MRDKVLKVVDVLLMEIDGYVDAFMGVVFFVIFFPIWFPFFLISELPIIGLKRLQKRLRKASDKKGGE